MSEYIVAKSGGTSNCDADSVELSLGWAAQSDIFVPSAPGKLMGESGPHAGKVTDILVAARDEYIVNGVVSSELADIITERFANIVHGLGRPALKPSWLGQIPARVEEAVLHSKDAASMLGERLQAEIYEAEGYIMLDPGRSPHDLGSDPEAWQTWLSAAFQPGRKYVLPGNTTRVNGGLITFSRGGSDTSGGFAAYGIKAGLNLNLTNGCARSADPDLIEPERLRNIEHLLYLEGRELGRNGTGLVHPAAMIPLMLGNIPTEIRSTVDLDAPYTTVDNDIARAEHRAGQIVALSLMENVVVHRVHEPGMAEAIGRLAAFETALAENEVTVIDSQGDGVDGQRYFVDAKSSDKAARTLQEVSRFGSVEVGSEISLITLVGFNLEQRVLDNIFNLALNSGIQGKSWQTQGYPISSGRNSLRIGIAPKDAKDTLSRIHHTVFPSSQ